MIIEKIYEKLSHINKKVETISIDWFERDKKILRKVTSSGEEIDIKIESILNEGDIVYQDDERVIVIEIYLCDLICVEVKSMKDVGRLCFELGNRHLSLAIDNDIVQCPFDNPTFEYLKKLGFNVIKIHDKFTGYIECKAHVYAYSHEHYHHE